MQAIAKEADAIYRRRVLQARQTSGAERIWDGPRLFEMACRVSRAVRGNTLDVDYIRTWADQHDTGELFEKICRSVQDLF